MQARASGILLPVFSLPGPYGIGTLGKPARQFIDFLAAGGQKFWQILPLVPPGGGNSPYMSPSSFAGNPLFLDLDELAEEGLLTQDELRSACRDNPDRVDYAWLHETRLPLLRKAFERGRAKYAAQLKEFEEQEKKARELEEQQKNNPPEAPIIKPDSIKPNNIIQMPSIIKKKEIPTIEVQQERAAENTGGNEEVQYAPVPVTAAPVGQ